MMQLETLKEKDLELIKTWLKDDEEGQKRLAWFSNPEAWFNLINFKDRFGWLILEGDQSIGFADLELINNSGRFVLYISESFRGHGLAKDVIDLIIKESIKLGVETLSAHIEEDNLPSKKAIESLGFLFTGKDGDNFSIYKLKL